MTVLEIAMEKMQHLSQLQQEEVLNFIEFLAIKSGTNTLEAIAQNEEKDTISAYDVLNKWAGILEDGAADISVNKKYMEEYGQV